MRTIKKGRGRAVMDGAVGEDVIGILGLFSPWGRERYRQGDTVLWRGQPMTCQRDHSAKEHPGWTPEAAPGLWRPWHARTPALALPYRMARAPGYAYRTGECMSWAKTPDAPHEVYRALTDGLMEDPCARPDAWALCSREEETRSAAPDWDALPEGHRFLTGDRFADGGVVYVVLREFLRYAACRPPARMGRLYRRICVRGPSKALTAFDGGRGTDGEDSA